MFSHSWKQAVKVGLVFCALSMPVWALHHGSDGHGRDGHGGQGGGYGGGGQNVPEGGSPLAYTAVSGAMIVGGMALARKSRAL